MQSRNFMKTCLLDLISMPWGCIYEFLQENAGRSAYGMKGNCDGRLCAGTDGQQGSLTFCLAEFNRETNANSILLAFWRIN